MTPANSARLSRNRLTRKLLCLKLSETDQEKSLAIKRSVRSNGKDYFQTLLNLSPSSSWPPQHERKCSKRLRPLKTNKPQAKMVFPRKYISAPRSQRSSSMISLRKYGGPTISQRIGRYQSSSLFTRKVIKLSAKITGE